MKNKMLYPPKCKKNTYLYKVVYLKYIINEDKSADIRYITEKKAIKSSASRCKDT